MNKLDVLVIGRNCIDYIAVVDRFPNEDKKAPLRFRLTEGGGQGGTSACCISKLGGKVALVGNIGDDEAGEFCLRRLNDYNVNVENIQKIKNAATPVAYLFVNHSNGKRTIIYEPTTLPKIVITSDLGSLLKHAKTISLDPQTTYLGKALKERIGPDTKIIYDCERWLPDIEEMMQAADYFIPSSSFFDSDTEKFSAGDLVNNIFRLKKMIKGQLIVTNGNDGAYYPLGHALYHVQAPEVRVRDTTGAGDNFHGAFALAVARGFDLHQCVSFSVAVASLSCRGYGGREAVPEWEEALALSMKLQTKALKR